MRRRTPRHLLLVLSLLLAACGSRVDAGAGDDEGLDEAEPTDEVGARGDTIGTVDDPCGGDRTGGEAPEGTPGVTDDTIRIGVISDRENDLAPVPTVGIEEAVEAFVALCNEAGGINGRQLELLTYDSEVLRTDDVTKEACADDLFALVGTGSVQDQMGIETREGCGLPEVAAYSATTSRAESADWFAPVPGLSATEFNVGPCRHIAEQHPDAVTRAAMVYTLLPAPEVRGRQTVEGCEAEAGFDFVVEQGIAFGETSFGPLVSRMKAEDVRYFTMVSAASDTLAVLRELAEQGVELEVIDLGQQYYDPAVAADPVTDGAYVLTNTVPFTETEHSPALQVYREHLERAGGAATTLGVQAFSAALLFATVVEALGDELTREALVEGLAGVTDWDGGGLHVPGSPGDDSAVECFLYLRIVDGDFERAHPSDGFDCDPGHIHTSEERFAS